MAQAVGPLAAVSSLASVGFSIAGTETKASGESAADTYKAEELERQAQYGELNATQVGGQLTQKLARTLGSIDAVRAAAHDDPTSPTGAAVRGYAETTGTEQKDIKVDSILAQAQQDESDAAFMRTNASEALLAGNISAGGQLLGGISGALRGLGGGGAGGGSLGSGGMGLPGGAATGGLY